MKKVVIIAVILCILASYFPYPAFAMQCNITPQHRQSPYKKYEAPKAEDTIVTDIPEKPCSREVENNYTFWSSHEYDPSIPFDENDVETMRRFYEIEVDGKTNGWRMSGKYYDRNNVLTWKGIWWSTTRINGTTTYVITNILLNPSWNENINDINLNIYDLRGDANFSGMQYVVSIFMGSSGRYDSINADNCPALCNLYMEGNEVYGDISYHNCPNMFSLRFNGLGRDSIDLSEVPKLTTLYCSENKLTEIDLSNVPDLETLYCENNILSKLDLGHVPKLANLNCSDNPLHTLDLTDLNISFLYCDNCSLYELYLPVKTTYMLVVHCMNNYLTELDVRGITPLDTLNCSGNYLTEIDLSGCVNLISVNCSDNMLRELDVSEISDLEVLRCNNNALSEIKLPPYASDFRVLSCKGNNLTELDLSKYPILQKLNCDNNRIAELDLSAQSTFRVFASQNFESVFVDFSCEENPLESISGIPILKTVKPGKEYENVQVTVNSSGGGYASIRTEADYTVTPIETYRYAKAESCDGCEFSGWYDGDTLISAEKELLLTINSPSVVTAKFSGERPAYNKPLKAYAPYAPAYRFTNTADADSYNAHDVERLRDFLETADESGVKNGTKLNSDYNADDISTWNFTNWVEVDGKLCLETLWADSRIDGAGHVSDEGKQLAGSLDLSGCTSLRSVKAPHGNLTSVKLDGCERLTALSLYDNEKLSNLSIKGCNMLAYIDLQNCNLYDFDITDSMLTLNISGNKLKALDISGKQKLIRLDVSNNELDTLTVSECTNGLYSLICENNNLTELYPAFCENVRYFDCSHNTIKKLANVESGYFCNLDAADCSYNEIEEAIDFGSWISDLNLSHNKLKGSNFGSELRMMCNLDVSYNELSGINLSDSQFLITLDCSHNNLSELKLPKDGQLVKLDCSYNEIRSVSLTAGMVKKMLIYFDCSHNRIESIDLANTGINLFYLNVSDNNIRQIDNAPARHILGAPLTSLNQDVQRVNIMAQGEGYIDYDLDTITAIGDDFAGFYTDGTKLTSNKTLPTDELESCTVTAMFGKMQLGDVNMDGTVNTGDAVVVLKHSAEMIQLTEEQKKFADTNHDGTVNTGDAVLILKYAAGMITTF